MEVNDRTLTELLRLTQENNRMLHSMRRNAFWGGVIKFAVYAVLLAAPIWLYLSYLGPMVEEMMGTYRQLQGSNAEAQAQFGDIQDMWREFQSRFSGQE